jgi:hypothetical protein
MSAEAGPIQILSVDEAKRVIFVGYSMPDDDVEVV